MDAIANETQSTDRNRGDAARQYVGELFSNVEKQMTEQKEQQ